MLHAIHVSSIIQQVRPDFKRTGIFSAICTKGSVIVKGQSVAEQYQLNALSEVGLCCLDKTCASPDKIQGLRLDKTVGRLQTLIGTQFNLAALVFNLAPTEPKNTSESRNLTSRHRRCV